MTKWKRPVVFTPMYRWVGDFQRTEAEEEKGWLRGFQPAAFHQATAEPGLS